MNCQYNTLHSSIPLLLYRDQLHDRQTVNRVPQNNTQLNYIISILTTTSSSSSSYSSAWPRNMQRDASLYIYIYFGRLPSARESSQNSIQNTANSTSVCLKTFQRWSSQANLIITSRSFGYIWLAKKKKNKSRTYSVEFHIVSIRIHGVFGFCVLRKRNIIEVVISSEVVDCIVFLCNGILFCIRTVSETLCSDENQWAHTWYGMVWL